MELNVKNDIKRSYSYVHFLFNKGFYIIFQYYFNRNPLKHLYTFELLNYIIGANIAFIRKRDGLHKHKKEGNIH